MKKIKKFRLKKHKFHPITTFVLMTIAVMILSSILSAFNIQVSYPSIGKDGELVNTTTIVTGMFNSYGFKYLISDATINFGNFVPLTALLIALIGLSVAHASGLIDTFIKRSTIKIDNKNLTFFIILIATVSSLINEVGYVILIPLAALVFEANGRNPLLGITAAFCGVSFGYGATLFAGSTEIALVPITEEAAKLIDSTYHVEMLSNLIAIIISSVVLSVVGTIVIEKIVAKKIGRYKAEEEIVSETKEIKLENVEEEEQKRLEQDLYEKKGLKYSFIFSIIFIIAFIYMLIPNLPFSGLLLEKGSNIYIYQLFGANSYLQNGFTFLVAIYFFGAGIFYAMGAKSLKNDKELIEKATEYLKNIGYLIVLIFFFSEFIAVFKETNIGTVIVGALANLLINIKFTGIPLVLAVFIFVFISGLFVTSQSTKWVMLAPVVVPLMMRSNLSPQFAQLVYRAGDSMAKGCTPFLSYFVIFLGYLNMYNKDNESISIRKAFSFISTYALIIGIAWIFILLFFYLLGIPIGPNVHVTM